MPAQRKIGVSQRLQTGPGVQGPAKDKDRELEELLERAALVYKPSSPAFRKPGRATENG